MSDTLKADMQAASFQDGQLVVGDTQRGVVVVRLGSIPVTPTTIGQGWSPCFSFFGFQPYIFLELRHTSGRQATWILNRDGRRISGDLASLSEIDRAELRASIQCIYGGFVWSLMSEPTLGATLLPATVSAFNPGIRDEIRGLCRLPDMPTLRRIRIDDRNESFHDVLRELGTTGEGIHAILRTDIRQGYLDACRQGKVTFSCLSSPLEQTNAKGFVLTNLVTAWRCVDPTANFVFYLLVGGFDQEASGIYIPQRNLLLSGHRKTIADIDVNNLPIDTWLFAHISKHAPAIFSFLTSDTERLAHFTWPAPSAHLGHYIWNELTGLNYMVNSLLPSSYPLAVDLGGAGGADFFGPLEGLFPELLGKITRRFKSLDDMNEFCYEHSVQALRFSHRHVPSSLRVRIGNVVADSVELPNAIHARAASTQPFIVFGLRVENRTVVDLTNFYIRLARGLFERLGPFTLVVDGHNRQHGNDRVHRSFLEDRAGEPPIAVEESMVKLLVQALADIPVTIISCVGMTVVDNLQWLSHADLVIAPWGAGLAKYRWCCNIPCYVFASRFNQAHKVDLSIYEKSEFMEAPAAYWMIAPEAVLDRTDVTTLVPMDPVHVPYYTNYEVDLDVVLRDLETCVDIASVTRGPADSRGPLMWANLDVQNDVVVTPVGELYLASGGHKVFHHALGLRTPMETSYRNFGRNITHRSQLANGIGATFLHVIFPDKQSVIQVGLNISEVIRLGTLYEQNCVDVWDRVLYLADNLRGLPNAYLRTDTHLSARGTFVAVKAIIRRLLGNQVDSALDTLEGKIGGAIAYTGDLGSKVTPQQSETKEILFTDKRISWYTNRVASGNNGLLAISRFDQAPLKLRLAFFGDSFGRDCCAFLGHLFQEVIFLRNAVRPLRRAAGLTAGHTDLRTS